jgi:DNA-binding transcriptional MerR regulator
MPELLEQYLTEDEMAAELGVTTRTLRAWRRDRRGPPVSLVGRTPMYFKPSAVAWLRSREKADVA